MNFNVTWSARPHESLRVARERCRDSVRAPQDKNSRPGPDAAELYKTPVKDKLRRKLSPYVSFEERDTDLFHMCRVSVVSELELVPGSLRWRRCGRQRAFARAAAPDAARIGLV